MDPWKNAREMYLAGLSDKEAAMFTSANMESVLEEVTQAEEAHGKSSKSRAFMNKIQPLISAIDQYGKALDVISGTSSGILCPLWGSLRILLHISQEFQKYFDKLLGMLERIGDILPRYSTFALLFKKHTSLQNALASVYLDIITFCMDAKKVFTSSSSASGYVPSSGLRILSKLLWKPFDEQFGDVLDKFRRHRKLVEEEARLADMVESAQERVNAGEERVKMGRERKLADEGRETVKEIKIAVDQQEIREMMSYNKKWISPEFCEEEYERLQDIRLEGSCEWILQKKELKEWKSPGGSQILWVHGIPGCGKTFIFTKLFEDLRDDAVPATLFFCVNGDDRRNTTSSIIRSWTFQLLEQFPNKIEIANQYRGNKDRPATQKEVTKLLLDLLEGLPTCYLAIDGLDECNDRKDFVHFLKRISHKHKVLIVSREQNDIKGLLSGFYNRMVKIRIDPDDTNSDIDSYISERLETDFYMQEEHLNEMVRERLLNCRGMFLWVRLMFDHLLMQTTVQELTDALDQLPTGLDETYDIVLKKINGLPQNQRLLANKIFMWVVTAHRPLTIAELRTALAIQPGDEKLDTKKLTLNPQATILTLCGPLVELMEPANTVNTIHFTVNQYLLRYLEESRILPEITAHYTWSEFESIHSLVAAICMTYLGFSTTGGVTAPSSCKEASILSANQSPEMAFLSYASLNWFLHVKQTSYIDTSLRQLAQQFLDPRKPNLETWWRMYWFSGIDSKESTRCPSKFSQMHVAAYLGLEKVIQSLGGENKISTFDSYHRTPLWWAVSMKHLPITKALLELGLDPKEPDDDLITPFHRAAINENCDILNLLLDSAPSAEGYCENPVADAEGWTPLHWAASRGNTNVLYRLEYYESIIGELDSTTNDGRTPLHLAALSNHYEFLKYLLRSFDKDWDNLYHRRQDCIDARDHSGLTALHLACKQGHMQIVQVLIYNGANTQICDTVGKTPVQYARLMGHKEVEIYLSRKGGCLRKEIVPREEVILRIGHAITKNNLLKTQETNDIPATNSRDSLDSSALEACINGHFRRVLLLSKKGRLFLGKQDHRGRNNLHHASGGGYEACVKQLLHPFNLRGRIDECDINGWNALHYATVGGFLTVVKLLVERGININLANNEGKTSFDIATEEGYQEIMEYLARSPKFSSDKIEAAFQWSKLHHYAWSGNLAGIKSAIRDGWDLSPRDRFGRIPLTRAAEVGYLSVVQMLKDAAPLLEEDIWDSIDLAANDHHEDVLVFLLPCLSSDSLNSDKKRTLCQRLLFWATKRGNEPISKQLHGLGVGLDLQDDSEERNTVLHIAAGGGHISLVEFFVGNGADVSAYNAYGMTALHEAARSLQAKTITTLLNHGADVNTKTSASFKPNPNSADCTVGDTPLHQVTSAKNAEIVEVLLQNGADMNIRNETGDTPLSMARLNVWSLDYPGSSLKAKAQAVLEVFERYQPQLTESTVEELQTPLHVAAAAGDVQAVEDLLEPSYVTPEDHKLYPGYVFSYQYGIYFNYREGPVSGTPLYYAVKGGHMDVVKLFLSFVKKHYTCHARFKDSDFCLLADTAREHGHGEVLQVLLEEQRALREILANSR